MTPTGVLPFSQAWLGACGASGVAAYPGVVVFDVAADPYARFMGRFSEPLAVQFAHLAAFWQAVHDVDPGASDEAGLAGVREGDLADLCLAAGLQHIEPGSLTVEIPFKTFTDWWEPFTLGVGPAGAYVSQLDQAQRDALRTRCAQLLPPAPFCISASAWSVLAHRNRTTQRAAIGMGDDGRAGYLVEYALGDLQSSGGRGH